MGSQHGRLSLELPPIDEVAAMVREADPLTIADDLGCSFSTLKIRLNQAGYTKYGELKEGTRSDAGLSHFMAFTFDDRQWEEDALCAQTDPEEFYPEKGGSTRPAKAVCARCTVAAECLDWALDHQERFGIWGGLSERERRRITRHQETA